MFESHPFHKRKNILFHCRRGGDIYLLYSYFIYFISDQALLKLIYFHLQTFEFFYSSRDARDVGILADVTYKGRTHPGRTRSLAVKTGDVNNVKGFSSRRVTIHVRQDLFCSKIVTKISLHRQWMELVGKCTVLFMSRIQLFYATTHTRLHYHLDGIC